MNIHNLFFNLLDHWPTPSFAFDADTLITLGV
jgi:hypothetical protein